MPELRKDPIVGRWVIIATDRAKRPVAPKIEPLPAGAFCPFCEGNEDEDAARDPRLPRPQHPAQREGLARPRRAQQVPGLADRGRPEEARRRHLRPHERRRRPRGHHRVPLPRNVDHQPLGGEHPRDALGLPRPPRRSQEGPAPRLRHGVQERRGGGRRLAGAFALAADRDADRADQRLGGDERQPGVFQLPRPLHLLRHDPPGADDGQARSCWTRRAS